MSRPEDQIIILPTRSAMGEYENKIDTLPGIIIDADWDPSDVFFAGPCPTTLAGLSQLLSKYKKEETKLEPQADPEPAYRASDFRVETIDGLRYGVHGPTGEMFPVDERTGKFCTGTMCFDVTTPKKRSN